MTKTELFIELATPDAQGVSRWVRSSEFIGRYADLQLGMAAAGVVQVLRWQKDTMWSLTSRLHRVIQSMQ